MTASAVVGKADSQDEACPVDYSQHFGHEGQARQLASLRVLLSAFTGVPGIIGLHGGLPPADAFPFTEMAFTLRDGTKMEIKDPAQVQPYTATTAFNPLTTAVFTAGCRTTVPSTGTSCGKVTYCQS